MSSDSLSGHPPTIHLRPVTEDDLPILFEQQLDPESNRMAMMYPHDRPSFDAHWARVLQDKSIVVRTIIADDQLAGRISCFPSDGVDYIGYWLGREFWAQGIATRALQLLLAEVAIRPLYARVAASNAASTRVLQKCGFEIVRHEWSPATDRFQACEEAVLELSATSN